MEETITVKGIRLISGKLGQKRLKIFPEVNKSLKNTDTPQGKKLLNSALNQARTISSVG